MSQDPRLARDRHQVSLMSWLQTPSPAPCLLLPVLCWHGTRAMTIESEEAPPASRFADVDWRTIDRPARTASAPSLGALARRGQG